MSVQSQKLFVGLSIAFAVVTLIITLVFFGWWALKERVAFGDQPFDPALWMSPRADHPCERGDMARDIRSRLLVSGMSKTDVTMRLGRPTWDDDTQIEYDLGTCALDMYGLRLYFDPNERLVHTTITRR
ncbi:MAG: hypothetical protein LBV44_05420 [Methylobacillus sp.]|jgi:hypothetical protein|nr:hypothetical protein [Methylobacillus sp.]